ncbi:hypothetical protein JMUB7525_27500 [Staphylococcus aureus]
MSRGLGDVYKRQVPGLNILPKLWIVLWTMVGERSKGVEA